MRFVNTYVYVKPDYEHLLFFKVVVMEVETNLLYLTALLLPYMDLRLCYKQFHQRVLIP